MIGLVNDQVAVPLPSERGTHEAGLGTAGRAAAGPA